MSPSVRAPGRARRPGRLSKALTFSQAEAVLKVAASSDDPPPRRGGRPRTRLAAYIVLSLLTGARTEELRALTWDHVDLAGDPDAKPPVPPYIAVWRSVRAGNDTKTRKSRRTIALPARCVEVLERHRELQARDRASADERGATCMTPTWSSPRMSAPRLTTRTSGSASGPSSRKSTAWTQTSGRHASCATASCLSYPTAASHRGDIPPRRALLDQ